MNKKILLGSIIAVVILVLVSFSGVVGYQTTSTSITRASPLFNIRISRAIDRDSNDLTCDYVGKGEVGVIRFPIQDNKIISMQNFVDILQKMDDETFNNFIVLVINRLRQDYPVKSKTVKDVITFLKKLRCISIQPENHKIPINTDSKDKYATEYCNTMGSCLTTTPDLFCLLFNLGCFVVAILLSIFITIHLLITDYIMILFRCSQ